MAKKVKKKGNIFTEPTCRSIIIQNTGGVKMEKINGYIVVDPDHVCYNFSRGFWSLDEEMDACHGCNHYDDEDSTCRCAANNE